MPKVPVNVEDAPEVILPIPSGKYHLEVVDAPSIEETKKKTDMMMVLSYKVSDEGEFFGRTVKDWIPFSMDTKLKRCCLSAGVPFTSEGFDTEDFIGKTSFAIIKQRPYKDPSTGEVRETSSIADYIIPSDG